MLHSCYRALCVFRVCVFVCVCFHWWCDMKDAVKRWNHESDKRKQGQHALTHGGLFIHRWNSCFHQAAITELLTSVFWNLIHLQTLHPLTYPLLCYQTRPGVLSRGTRIEGGQEAWETALQVWQCRASGLVGGNWLFAARQVLHARMPWFIFLLQCCQSCVFALFFFFYSMEIGLFYCWRLRWPPPLTCVKFHSGLERGK